MWPYRPGKLTELLGKEELSALLARDITERLGSNLLLVEPGGDDGEEPELLCSIDEPTGSPFCSLLRHGQEGAESAFAGADAACGRCEKKFAARALRELKNAENGPREPVSEGHFSARCHMGLQDLAAPIVVENKVLAILIAGRRIAGNDERSRILKRVGKLGKLTQAEKRSMEKAGNDAVAPIIPASEESRQRLLDEIDRIPLLGSDLEDELTRSAAMLSAMAGQRVLAARQAWEIGVLDSLVPASSELPLKRAAILNWLDSAVAGGRQALGIDFLAVFGRLPESIGKTTAPLQLLSQDGLRDGSREEDEESVNLRSEDAALALDPGQLAGGAGGAIENGRQGLEATSSLIGALQATPASPPGWKDRLTKSSFVASPACSAGLELVFVFGPPSGKTKPSPEEEDCPLLLKAARALCDRYLLASLESKRRELARYEEKLKKTKPSGPLRLQRFDARKLIDSCLGSMQELAGSRSITIGLGGLPERLMMEADRPKLKDVFDCILLHAIEFARPNPENGSPSIVVSIRRDKKIRGRLLFNFDVIGRFLSGREHRKLFTPAPAGAAGEGEDSRSSPGSVGFREAQQNISWHKGRLKVESERLGNGKGPAGGKKEQWSGRTVFTVEIPSHPPKPRPGKKAGKARSRKTEKKPGPRKTDANG